MGTDQQCSEGDPSLLDDALAAAGNGWSIFPCWPGTKDPAVKWGSAATNDLEQVRRWWTENPRYNIGIACGPSGLVVIDLDVGEGKDGVKRWAELTAEHDTPPTYTVETPSGGRHHYFTLPDDWEPVGNSASKLADGIDVRAGGEGNAGGFVVGAGSVRADGKAYTVVTDISVPAPFPKWVYDMLTAKPEKAPKPSSPPPRSQPAHGEDPLGRFALDTDLANIRNATEGKNRNTRLHAAAFHQSQLTYWGRALPDAREQIEQAGYGCGLNKKEIEATVQSGWDGGQKKPGDEPKPRWGSSDTAADLRHLALVPDGDDDTAPGKKKAQAVSLVELAENEYRLGIADDGRPFAVPLTGPNLAVFMRGPTGLRQQLSRRFYNQKGQVPSQSALTDALGVIEAKAQSASREPLWLRVGEHGAGVVIDLGTAAGAAVEANAEGWRIVDRSPIVFRRTELTMPLPIPERGGDLEQLRAVLNVNDESWPLLLGWLISVFIPEIPHPILLFAGEQGCGKSTAARLVTKVADPSAAPLQAPPASVENWITTAQGSHVVTLDNLSGVPVWLSDALCRAVTGESLAKRTLYTDGDLSVTKFRRCVVLTTIAPGALRGDLAERLVTVDLERIDPRHRRSETELRARFDQMHPRLLGAALDLLTQVLEALPGIDLEQHPRMADMAEVYAAVDQVTGSTSLATYLTNSDKIAQAVVSDDLVASAVVDLMAAHDNWTGTPTQLLDQLTQQQYPDSKRPPKGWPQTTSNLSRQLKLATTALRQVGFDVESDRDATPNRKRIFTFTKTQPEPSWAAWAATKKPTETPPTPKTPPDLGVSDELGGLGGMGDEKAALSLLDAFRGSTLEAT